jgi:hypothetical protein
MSKHVGAVKAKDAKVLPMGALVEGELEVTPGLQQEQSPTPISLCHDLFIKRGDRMEVNSKQCCSNSETRPGMHGQVRS